MPVEKSIQSTHTHRHAQTHLRRETNTRVRARLALQWLVPNPLLSRYTGHVGLPLGPQETAQSHREADSVGCSHSSLGSNPFPASPIKLDSLNPPRSLQTTGSVLQALVHNSWISDQKWSLGD